MKHFFQILITVFLFGAFTSSAQKALAPDGFSINAPSAALGDAADVIIGDGLSVDKYLPVAPWYEYSYTQTIYLQSEINISGLISEIRYHYNGNSAWSDEVDIYMGTTTKSSFTNEAGWIPVNELTLVYSGLLAVTATEGWVSIVLDDPFNYDNTGNLVVAVHEKTPGSHTDGDDFYCTEMVDEARSLAVASDGANPDPASPPDAEDFSGWSPYFIPNTAFLFETEGGNIDGIRSTETGGNWNDPSTWIDGVVPGVDDNAVIDGPVSIEGNYACNSLYVTQSGLIQNGNDLQVYSLEVNGNLLNEGVLRNNPDFSSTFMRVVVHGDVTNSATMSFGELALAGENGNTISQNGSSPFTVSELQMWFNATGPVTFGSDVSFSGTNIALNNVQATLAGRLNLFAGAGLSDVVLNGQGNILSGRDNAILSSTVSLSNVNLQDNIQIVGNSVSFGEGVVIEGTVENGDEYQIYTLEAIADFVNEGVLRNNPNFGTALNISVLKNVTNSGTIGVQQFHVNGEIDQTITLVDESGIDSEVFFHSNMEAGPYQWQKDGVDITDATSEFLKFENGLSSADAGVFSCISNGTVSRTVTVVVETNTVDALPLPYYDGFEDGAEGWLAYDLDEDGYTWGRFNDATEAYAGEHGLRVEWNASGNNDWLVSPLLEFPADEPVTLSFYAKSFDVNFLESFEVKVISEDGEITDHIASENDIPDVYNEYTYDLSAYAGQNVYFAVVCVSVDENYLYVDEFNVEAISFTSIPDVDHLNPSIGIYPNPVSDPSVVSIEVADNEITGVELLNITGLIVDTYSISGASGKERIDVSGQKPGVYFLRIYTNNGAMVRKLIIQ